MTASGPDFISLQVRDLQRSRDFYTEYLGLEPTDAGPPHAVVFATQPIAFAIRDIAPGVDLDAAVPTSGGVGLWFHADGVQAVHDRLAADGHAVIAEPFDGPFGRTFTFADPDGYLITLHEQRG